MRTETITYNIYKYDELTPEAKAYAIEKYREDESCMFWDMLDDELRVIKKTAQEIGAKLDYEFNLCGYSHVSLIFSNDFQREMFTELSGVRAAKYIFNNWIEPLHQYRSFWKGNKSRKSKCTKEFYPIDGYWNGYALNDCYIEFCEKVKAGENPDLEDFITSLEEKLCKDYMNQAEYLNSDEAIEEMIIANGYEFTKDGEMY